MESSNYWKRRAGTPTSRRKLMAGGGAAVTGLAAFGLVGCGGDDDDTSPTAPSGAATTAPGGTAAPAGSPTAAVVKGVAGGTYKTIGGPVGGSLDIHRTNTPVEYGFIWPLVGNFLIRFGIKDGLSEPDLAASLPEIPGDGTELIFKIRPDAKFQMKATDQRPLRHCGRREADLRPDQIAGCCLATCRQLRQRRFHHGRR